MSSRITTGHVHHLRLTVADVARAQAFYSDILGFDLAMELPTGVLLTNGKILLGLSLSPDPESAIAGDRFDENRVGLDHLSFAVDSMDDLRNALRTLDDHNV